ncbi:MAG: DUF4065 domain-containing protein [Burkholderiaceae bacterium]|jgi:uncharacterized phage-associated protein|nr:DUF4065 domain-containing protein [Burkholderiaceae bacterium]
MAYRPRVVANALLQQASRSGTKLSHLKLQKLVFFLHAWYLALYKEPLISEPPEAWPYGPVFSSLYHELKRFGSNDIEGYLTEVDPQSGREVVLIPNRQNTKFWDLAEQVWDRYGKLTAAQLSSLSHIKDGPWDEARHKSEREISDKSITDFYSPQLIHAG